MSIDRDVLDAVRDMDAHELRRLLILAKARLEQQGVSFPGAAPHVRLRSQPVKCGKPNCTQCPHGPYWYAYWREDGKRRSRYLGKLEDLDDRGLADVADSGFSDGRLIDLQTGTVEGPA